jgi:acyl carrier protein
MTCTKRGKTRTLALGETFGKDGPGGTAAKNRTSMAEPCASATVKAEGCPKMQTTEFNLETRAFGANPAMMPSPDDDAQLREVLKRCSASTREAAREFRRTGSAAYLPAVVDGLIEHYSGVRNGPPPIDDSLRLVEDLAIDSLTLLEIVYLAEDVLQISIDNVEIRPLRTVGDMKAFLAAKMGRGCPQGLPLTSARSS